MTPGKATCPTHFTASIRACSAQYRLHQQMTCLRNNACVGGGVTTSAVSGHLIGILDPRHVWLRLRLDPRHQVFFPCSRDIGQFDIPMSRCLRATTSLVSVSSRPPNVSTSLCHDIDIDASRHTDIDLWLHPVPTSSMPRRRWFMTSASFKLLRLWCLIKRRNGGGIREVTEDSGVKQESKS
ncbi:hypothetical protein ACFE04_011278 [Oxalis oulophora]